MEMWDEVVRNLRELAYIDEAHPYEIDQTFVGMDKEGIFYLVTASGCSCWEGSCCVEKFSSLVELFNSLRETEREYNPSMKGAETLSNQILISLFNGK